MRDQIFNRTLRLVGRRVLNSFGDARVVIFGVGGVGSWAAEALVRSGVTHLTIVDPDRVALSNINRQLPALMSTVGAAKVEVLGQRFLDINPVMNLRCVERSYNADTAADFDLGGYDYVIDAIDSLADKALLILNATRAGVRLYSSMGAALKMDPSRISVAEFWKVKGCPLAAALRNRFKRTGEFPARKFKCVYSDELLKNHDDVPDDESGAMTFSKRQVNGAMVHITAIFGMTLASLVIRDIIGRTEHPE